MARPCATRTAGVKLASRGLADGGHPLDIELIPQPDGSSIFQVTSDDFGKTLKGLGITDTVKEGKLKITGASTKEQPRTIVGKVFIGGFSVKDLPVLVVLMNATSPFGIVNLFSGRLEFDHLLGNFRWKSDQLVFDDIRASGNSVGMTIDGKLDLNNSTADLNGTMAPFSIVNRILNYIPLIGDMLTGRRGGRRSRCQLYDQGPARQTASKRQSGFRFSRRGFPAQCIFWWRR